MRVFITKATKVGDKRFWGGFHTVDDETGKALIATGNATLEQATQGTDSVPVVASDHYGKTRVEHREKTIKKPKAKTEAE